MKHTHRLLAFALFSFAGIAVDAAEFSNWSSWRGPTGQGLAPAAQPPTAWSEEKNIRWKTRIPGLGFSTPIVWEDRIFLLTAIETSEERRAAPAPAAEAPPAGGRRKGGGGPAAGPAPTKVYEFAVIALDRASGKIVWQKTARREVPHEGRHATTSFASASPVTDGERLWVPFGSRGFYCYDLQGNLLWENDLGDMKVRGAFGEGSSPVLAGDLLLIAWDHEEQSCIVALDKKTGAEVWRKNREERSSWSTPLIVEVGGKLQAIVAASNRTRSYDAATGEPIWEASGLTGNVIPTPVVGHGMVYVMSGYSGSSIQAIKLTSRGDVTGTPNVVWQLRQSAPYAPSPVLSGELLFVSKSNDPYLSCVDALNGAFYYRDQALPGVRGIYASPLAANGYVYIVGREGTTLVIRDAARFEIVATNKLNDKIDA
ncbi:MAG: PQQ-binding-like beta-propeller repeat protein, partial [Opitutaceae bacterium]